MARSVARVPASKVGFLVEGDHDKAFVEAFVPRIVGPDVNIHVIRIGGKAALSSTYADAIALLDQGYERVIVLVDADTTVTEEIEQQRADLADIYRRYGIEHATHVCMAVPMLESWLLAAYEDAPERRADPKRTLARAAGTGADRFAELARALPISTVRKRSASFDAFVRELERVGMARAGRAAEGRPSLRPRPVSGRG